MIRNAIPSDAKAIWSIMNQAIIEGRNAYTEPFDAFQGQVWFDRLAEQSLRLKVIQNESSEVAGWGALTPYRGGRGALATTSEITFYMHNKSRGRGLGTELINALEAQAIEIGMRHLVAILLDDNVPSQNLLKKKGYEIWANFQAIVHFPHADKGHLYMGKHLP